jgi:RNA recognition motif. (a.k.a. RRM, RBD, or RNP domain)
LECGPGFTYNFIPKKSRPNVNSCTVHAGLLILGRHGTAFAASKSPQGIPRTNSRQGCVPVTVNYFCELFLMKLYVGNLPFSATEDSVRTHFAAHGTVEKVSLVNDRETGRPRGFGFVEMPSADATRAMQALDGKDFGGRPLKVNEAQERDRGAPRGNFGGGGGGRGRY